MQRLSGTDANFLYQETINTPQHVGGIQYLDVANTAGDTFYNSLKSLIKARIHLVPYLTSRLQPMPWNIDHPVWVRDTGFDIDEHFHHTTLDAPGTIEQLEALCADLYEPMLDRSKPLWEMWVIDGLENGQVAVFSKTHHACLDGMASVALQEILGDLEPTPREVEPVPADFWNTEDVSYPTLMRESWFNLARYNIDRWASWPAQQAANARVAQLRTREAAERPTSAPKAPWNAAIDGKRGLAGAQFSLSTLKALGKATGSKVNDVVLAITGEAINRYLARQGVELNAPLIAGCPVSLRKAGDTSMNNQVTMMMVSMENDIEDPRKRLASIHAASDEAKKMLMVLGDTIQTDFGGPFVPAQMEAFARATQTGDFADQGEEVPMNVVVSNVPGLRVPVYSAGARVVGTTPCSIVSHGGGLNVTVSSYMDRLDLGLTAASKVVSDIHALRDDFVTAYDDLVASVLEKKVLEQASAKDDEPHDGEFLSQPLQTVAAVDSDDPDQLAFAAGG